MAPSTFPPIGTSAAPALCLDCLQFARQVFAADLARWFDSAAMISITRQAQQMLQPEVLVLPLLDWLREKWRVERGDLPRASLPAKAIKQVLDDEAIRIALVELLAALASVTGSRSVLALGVAPLEQWLQWAGQDPDAALDETDAEDLCVYLAALFNHLPAATLGGLCLQMERPIDGDRDLVFEPLINTARHFGWPVLAAGPERSTLPQGCAAYASAQPQAGEGWFMAAGEWNAPGASKREAAFLFSTLPPNCPPAQALKSLGILREGGATTLTGDHDEAI